MNTRKAWEDVARLMPWQQNPDAQVPRPLETVSDALKPVLYDAHGKPLVRRRPRLGFRPEDAK